MKTKILVLYIFLFYFTLGYSQNWGKKKDFPGRDRVCSSGFVVDEKLFLVGGQNFDNKFESDFWQYNSLLETWKQLPDFPGNKTAYAISFSIDSFGYFGCGYEDQNRMWRYNSKSLRWDTIPRVPDSLKNHAFAFSIGKKAFVGGGYRNGKSIHSFWEYDSDVNKWIRRADFPDSAIYVSTFSLINKGYVLLGRNYPSGQVTNDCYEYDPQKDKWIKKNAFPGTPRCSSINFNLDNFGYIGGGTNWDGKDFSDLWKYDPIKDSWLKLSDTLMDRNLLGVSFSSSNKGYYVTGNNYQSSSFFVDFTPGPEKLKAYFDDKYSCGNHSAQFYFLGQGNLSSIHWTFEGGIPNKSNDKDPIITYPTQGSYKVKLIVADSLGVDSLEKTIEISTVNVSLAAFSSMCSDALSLSLTGGSPLGGTYSGKGVKNGKFYPFIAGVGKHKITYTLLDTSGCKNSAEQTIEVNDCNTTIVNNQNQIESYFTILPNPSNGIFGLHYQTEYTQPSTGEFVVSDLLGRVVLKQRVLFNGNDIKLDLSEKERGMYILVLTIGKERLIKKIMIE